MKKTTDQFILEANVIHGNKYDYSLVNYINIKTKVSIICPDHGVFSQLPSSHLSGRGCKLCGATLSKKTCMIKYGTEYAQQSNIIQQKIYNTNLSKYGGHPKQTQSVQAKYINTCNQRYGVDNPSSIDSVKNKRQQTYMNRYGYNNPFSDSTVQLNIKQTLLSKYGHTNPAHGIQAKQKILQHNRSKYGIEHFNQSKNISSILKIQDYDWLFEQYITQNKSAIQIADELNLQDTTIGKYLKLHEIKIKQLYTFSYRCLNWLESIIENEGIYIQHAINECEYKIPGTRYKADGFCKETNTIYEFHGDYWHGNPNVYQSDIINESTNCSMGELYQKTLLKEQKIKELGYNLVVMWELEWNQIKQDKE